MSKVSAAQAREAKTPVTSEETSIFRRSMEKSERQLEQLVEELRQMSKTPAMALPPIIMQSSSSGSSQDDELEASSRFVPTSSRHQQQKHSGGREWVVDSSEQLERSNLSDQVSLATRPTPHPHPRGIMPTVQPENNATHRYHGTGYPTKSAAWEKIGGGLVKEYRRENTREYSRPKDSTADYNQTAKRENNLIQHPSEQLLEMHPHELRSQPDIQMQVESGVSYSSKKRMTLTGEPTYQETGVSQLARDSYEQLLATELEIQRLR